MELKVNTQKDQPLLARKEVNATLHFTQATPSNADVTKEVAKAAKSSEELVTVKSIYTKFGAREAEVTAYVYSTADAKKKFDPKIKVKTAASAATGA